MVKIVRTDWEDQNFIKLVNLLDGYLADMDGAEHSFYAQFNKIDKIKHVVVAYDEAEPVSCGAMREYASGTMEIKRMYTSPGNRGKGIATMVLAELEKWAIELSYEKCLLETGKRQPEAVRLYQKNGYIIIPNYGQYVGMDNSVCFEKKLNLDNGRFF